MTAAERRALLGDDVIDRINTEVDTAIAEHPPTEDTLRLLRPILARGEQRRPSAEQSAA